jgi:hypothetical protein
MLWIKPEVCVSPGSITGKDVVGFIPGLRFSLYRQQQWKTKNYEKADDADCYKSIAPVS